MNASDAINKPKFHHQWLPDEVTVEKDFDAAVKKQLQTMGYKITEGGSIGKTEAIRLLSNGKRETSYSCLAMLTIFQTYPHVDQIHELS